MSIVYQTNKKTGKQYAYETTSIWIPELKRPKTVRTYLGRVNPDGSIIIPPAKRAESSSSSSSSFPSSECSSDQTAQLNISSLQQQIEKKNAIIHALEARNAEHESALSRMQEILDGVCPK